MTGPASRRRHNRRRVPAISAFAVVLALVASGCRPREEEPNEAARRAIAEAAVRRRDGDWSGSLRALDEARRVDTVAPLASIEEGRLRARMGDWPAAARAYEDAAARAPRSPRPSLELARLYRAHGRTALAERSVGEAQRRDGQDPDVLVEAGRLRLAAGDLWGAATALGKAVRARPNDAEAFRLMGLVEWKRDALAEAESALGKAVEKNPEDAAALCDLGGLYLQAGRLRDALGALERARGLGGPVTAATAALLSRANEALGRGDEAARWGEVEKETRAREEGVRALEEPLWTRPADVAAYRALAAALLASGRLDEAEGIYRGWAHLEPASAEAWQGVAAACRGRGDAAGAEQALARLPGEAAAR